jgi:hypothetical protein
MTENVLRIDSLLLPDLLLVLTQYGQSSEHL